MRLFLYVMAAVPLLFWFYIAYCTYLWSRGFPYVAEPDKIPLSMMLGATVGIIGTLFSFAMNDARLSVRVRVYWAGIFIAFSAVAPLIWLISQRSSNNQDVWKNSSTG